MKKFGLFLALIAGLSASAVMPAFAQEATVTGVVPPIYCHANDLGEYGLGRPVAPVVQVVNRTIIHDLETTAPTADACHERALRECRAASTHPDDCRADFDRRLDYLDAYRDYPQYAPPDFPGDR